MSIHKTTAGTMPKLSVTPMIDWSRQRESVCKRHEVMTDQFGLE